MVLVVSGKIGLRVQKLGGKHHVEQDKTSAVIKEIVDGAKVVKMLAWEDAYLEHACRKRSGQLALLSQMRRSLSTVLAVGRASRVPQDGARTSMTPY